ncbi:YesL family protein [Halalkalibacter alkaliphilus]|uniref:YesL family protein n=1 Tax=Halalkalibacter alkaliphilus TaxID=2917993 RepID=A0A9X2CX24_9BACI|nr:YesL family protein [Halalkalibacter alkaliphilus]MCL7749936.1 YesL family protein [Halalkalibacter alkaliphilus]
MVFSGVIGYIYMGCQWIVRFAYVNILWIIFSCAGLLIFGIAPATTAMFAVVRKWIRGEKDINIFKYYWNTFRSEFYKSNIYGILFLVLSIVLYVNYIFLSTIDGWLLNVMTFGFISFLVLFIITLLYIFPLIVHYQLNKLDYLKYAIIIGLTHPLITLLMLVQFIAIYLLIIKVPGFLPFFSVSSISFVIMWLANYTFNKIEDRKEESLKVESSVEKT